MTRSRVLLPALGLAVCAISCAAIFFRLAGEVHPLLASAVRLLCSALCFLPWGLRDAWAVKLPPRFWRVACVAGALYALHFGTWVWSLQLTSVASSVTLVTITPIMLAMWGLWTRRDVPSRRLMWGLVWACAGVVVLGLGDMQGGASSISGDLLAIVGAAAMGGYFLSVRPIVHQLPLGLFSLVTCAVGGVILAGVSTLVVDPLVMPSTQAWGWLVLSSLIPQVIGHTLLTWSLRYVTPTMAGVVTLGEPVGAALLGVVVLHEHVNVTGWAGCALILCGVLIATCSLGRRVEGERP